MTRLGASVALPRRAATQIVCAAAVVLQALGCTEPDGRSQSPLTLSARYALATVDGRALPARVDSSATEFGEVLGDTIVFTRSGSAIRTIAFRRVTVVIGEERSNQSVAFEYYADLDMNITIGSFAPCPDLCIENDSGILTAERMDLITHWYGHLPHLVFLRIPD